MYTLLFIFMVSGELKTVQVDGFQTYEACDAATYAIQSNIENAEEFFRFGIKTIHGKCHFKG